MKSKCTLLLSSYDGGEDLWTGFFIALKTQWPEMDMQIVLNTECKKFSFEGLNIRTVNVNKMNMPWGKRLKNTLRHINTEYVLLFLEDYWLDSRVDDGYFKETIKWMDENPDIATFSFYPCMPGDNIQDDKFDKMELRPQRCEYKLNCQVAIWRREKLIKFIKNHEDPWEWEIWGSQRASKYKERFYTLKEGEPLPFSYGDPQVGCLIHRGKWVEDVAIRICKQYSLDIDFSLRGFEDFDIIRQEQLKNLNMTFIDKLKEGKVFTRALKKIKRKFREFKSLI